MYVPLCLYALFLFLYANGTGALHVHWKFFPLISVWPVDPREDVTAAQTLLIKPFVRAKTLLFSCTDVVWMHPPPSSTLLPLHSIIYRSPCGNFMFVSMETDTSERMDAFMYVSFCFWRDVVLSVFLLVVARSDWIVYVGREAGEGNTLEEKRTPSELSFLSFALKRFLSGIWTLAANNLNALRVSRQLRVQRQNRACEDGVVLCEQIPQGVYRTVVAQMAYWWNYIMAGWLNCIFPPHFVKVLCMSAGKRWEITG